MVQAILFSFLGEAVPPCTPQNLPRTMGMKSIYRFWSTDMSSVSSTRHIASIATGCQDNRYCLEVDDNNKEKTIRDKQIQIMSDDSFHGKNEKCQLRWALYSETAIVGLTELNLLSIRPPIANVQTNWDQLILSIFQPVLDEFANTLSKVRHYCLAHSTTQTIQPSP